MVKKVKVKAYQTAKEGKKIGSKGDREQE